MSERVGSVPQQPVHVPTQGARLSPPHLRAILSAAVAAYLDEETTRTPGIPNPWPLAARADGRGAGSPWPLGLVNWRQAERPR